MAARATTFAVLAAAAVASRAAAPRHAPAAHAAPVDVNVDAGGTFARVSMSDPRSATSKPLEHGEHNAAWLFGARAEPNPGAVVTHGPARFTVLTTGVVRLEYSPHRPPVFHDEGSFAFVNRYFETVPDFTASTSDDGVLTLDTPRLTLTYAPAAAPHGAFTPASLRAFIKDTGTTWTPGAPATGSLHAVIRTLDRIGRALSIACVQPAYLNDTHCEEGVASRDGWAVLDDSLGARWEDYNTEWPWTTGRAEPPLPARADTCAAVGWDRWECIWGNHLVNESACRAKGCCWDPVAAAAADGQPTAQHFVAWCWWPDGSASPASEYKDWYLFGFGTDYRAALYDYRDVAGPPALLPNYALGPHYSRWFSYADWEEREIVATFARNAIPLSVMQVDMDWHDSYPRGVPNVPPALSLPRELEPWTGFTIWEDMYPAVADMQAHFHARGVKSMWNLHPHFGIQFYDDVYAEFAARLGRGAEAAEGKPMLGDYVNRTWAEPFFALPIAKLDAHGIDAWWIDWQAGEWTPLAGLSPTAWLSYAFSSNPYRYGAVASRSGPVLAAAGLPADAALSAMAPLPHGDVDGEGSEHEHPPRAPSSAEPSRNGIRFSDRPFIMNRWGGLGSHRRVSRCGGWFWGQHCGRTGGNV